MPDEVVCPCASSRGLASGGLLWSGEWRPYAEEELLERCWLTTSW